MIVAPPSRRERKKNATREAIHQAALSLTEELGLAAVTVEAITERADVAPRTFFNHFPSKVHAVLGRDPDQASRVRQALLVRPADEAPLTALRHVLLEDFLPADTSAEHLLRRFQVVRAEPFLLSTMHAAFEEAERGMVAAIGQRTGLPETDLYPALVVAAAVSAMRVALMRWCELGGHEPIEPVLIEAFDQLSSGLVPPATESKPL
jgi:AcrR family transcriptional regulator